MSTRAFAERIGRETLIGTFAAGGSSAAAELIAGLGFDVVCIDAEHTALDMRDVEDLIRAVEAGGSVPIVRVVESGPDIGRALDCGARGVMVPRVESRAQAEDAVARALYPPTGRRGAGPGRASVYGRDLTRYLHEANDEIVVMAQIETMLAVERITEIAATPGLDMVFIGPGDLAVSLGAAPGSEAHSAAIERIIDGCRAYGVPTGIYVSGADEITELRARGVEFFLIQSDLAFMTTAATEAERACRRAVSREDTRITA